MFCSNGDELPEDLDDVTRLNLMAYNKRIPLHAMIELTYRCNVDCVHCYCQHLDDPTPKPELKTQEWIDIVDQLADMGSLYLAITGGEIFIRPDFWDIAFHAKKREFAITLFTNGTMITEKVADRLVELRPKLIEISLLHPEEEKHDLLSQKKGSYKKIMQTVKRLKERKLPFKLKTTLMKQNIDHVEALDQIAKETGAVDFYFGTTFSPKNDGSRSPLAQSPSLEQYKEYLKKPVPNEWYVMPEQTQEEKNQKPTCGAGYTSIAVNPFGELLPCIQMMTSFGDVRQSPVKQLWENPPENLKRLTQIKTYGELPECHGCELINFCSRCHGIAHLETGRWEAKSKQACEKAAIAKEVDTEVKMLRNREKERV